MNIHKNKPKYIKSMDIINYINNLSCCTCCYENLLSNDINIELVHQNPIYNEKIIYKTNNPEIIENFI
jgi:hypothetical protein